MTTNDDVTGVQRDRQKEMVEILTREGDLEQAARFAAMTDDEYAACTARAQVIAEIFVKDPLMMLELENELTA